MLNERELIKGCIEDDIKCQHLLFETYAGRLLTICRRYAADNSEAEDVLQEAFLDAFRSLEDFSYRSTFGAWLKRFVINKSINVLRKRKMDLVELDQSSAYAVAAEDEIDEMELQLKVEGVKKAIRLLPDGYRAVISLYLLEGYDQEEIAGILGITHNTVRTQYIRAKQKLLMIINQGGKHE